MEFTCRGKTSDIIPLIRKHGVAVVPNFLSPDIIEDIISPSREALSSNHIIKYEKYPSFLRKVFAKHIWSGLAKEFFQPRRYRKHRLHQEVIISSTSGHDYLHFNKLFALQLLLYLTDNVSFSVVPGTHTVCEGIRLNQSGKSFENILNKTSQIKELEEYESNIVPITGKAGTLIVFNTDTLHKGGTVKEGKEKLVLRSYTRVG